MADWEAARRDDPLPEDGEVELGGSGMARADWRRRFPRVASGGDGFDVGLLF